jgi:uncharacterized protein (DUF427 family)
MESLWDYPRPPRVEPSSAHVVVELDGEVLAETQRSRRVLETSHPPVYYIPAADVRTERLRRRPDGPTWCEFKGAARYYDAGDRATVAWSRPAGRLLRWLDHLGGDWPVQGRAGNHGLVNERR